MGSRVRVPPRSPMKSGITCICTGPTPPAAATGDTAGTHYRQALPAKGKLPAMIKDHFPYETCRWSAGRPDQAKRRFDELELTGPQNVRARLAQSNAGSGGALAIGATQMTIGFAQEWLAWHDREKAAADVARHERQIFWTRFAAISATIAGGSAAIGWAWTILHKP